MGPGCFYQLRWDRSVVWRRIYTESIQLAVPVFIYLAVKTNHIRVFEHAFQYLNLLYRFAHRGSLSLVNVFFPSSFLRERTIHLRSTRIAFNYSTRIPFDYPSVFNGRMNPRAKDYHGSDFQFASLNTFTR